MGGLLCLVVEKFKSLSLSLLPAHCWVVRLLITLLTGDVQVFMGLLILTLMGL